MDSLYNWFCTHLNLNKETMGVTPGDKQCEVVLVGCGAPKRGMGEFLHSIFFPFSHAEKEKLCLAWSFLGYLLDGGVVLPMCFSK